MPKIDDPSGPFDDATVIEVDATSIDGFAGTIEGQVTANYIPYAARIVPSYELGARFGFANRSAEVKAARDRHTDCLRGAIDQLRGFAEASQALVAAARFVAEKYRDSDAFSAATVDEVAQELNAAMRTVQKQRGDAV
ncbi:hypothetical protein Val02_87130 [Virgisporangium aliadipatigenens]|uniref:Uncharacterized protein n=1 Tax=Virgisporangium aliadipatigenens TaxID=741659 RepID=A0A8J3YW86_9ACTN|nr:hypothetical protein [Virgisporangium aliadipatigenens]GIJ51827.1 hypothetical protein Val02_87130 [Virgisporangium aliadipatigenens]